MITTDFTDNARVSPNGQVTIPKDIRDVLGVCGGSYVTFVVEDGNVRIVNPAIYAMQEFQKEMVGEAAKAGLKTDEDVMALVKQIRSEG